MKLKIQYKPIADLIPYARNSRTHSDAQVAQIASSIKEFGWTNPVLLDGENGIIAGHGRVMAASKLGEKEVPTIELSHMDENQKRAYIIADNKLALNAGWDNEMLMLEVADLKDAGYDLGLTGFNMDEINALNGIDNNEEEEFKEPSDESRNLLMIECQGEHELEKLFEEMQQRGFECKILS
jgi:ParB-like chromosome segregation protein Spo0J